MKARTFVRWIGVAVAFVSTVSIVSIPAYAETGVTNDTIKIGLFGEMTGAASLYGKSVYGAEAVYKQANDAGGVNGRKIEIVREDESCDPSKGIAAVRKLVSQDQVFMIHGGVCSGVVLAARPELIKSGVPFMDLGAASVMISMPFAANIFQPVATTDAVGRRMADFAMSRAGTTKVAIISHSDDWGKSNRDPAVAELMQKFNLQPVADLSMERGTSDATPQVLKVKTSGAQVVLAMLYPAELAIFMRDAYKYGLQVPVLGSQGVSLDDTRQRAGNPHAADNLYVFYPLVAPLDDARMQPWLKLVNRYGSGGQPETFTFLGMGGAAAVVQALKDSGRDLTRGRFIAAMNNLHSFDTGVMAAPLTFTATDHAGLKTGSMLTYVNGKATVVQTLQK
ncbi:branched-chain amino acid transport system substrate-binding protein [Paraburkholderia sp. CI2]|uniref:ABC transporter substrate-binding protein n=1 Tax=unclassified Paraburkholderia TaxID=2615204 RepID=UPI00160B669C|nr:ABC transporter substrate-binding protein [Paraburkholderia sp. CI2]MBB5466778.1 branched-chain amino acid transport system substrate-binding protein [Paraburkholderia sp. CI2]